MGKFVYIAGPMTGLPDYNRAAFFAAARWIRDNTDFVPVHTAWMESGFQERDYLTMALHLLLICDAMILLPGWEKSGGVEIEFDEASKWGIPAVEMRSLKEDEQPQKYLDDAFRYCIN